MLEVDRDRVLGGQIPARRLHVSRELLDLVLVAALQARRGVLGVAPPFTGDDRRQAALERLSDRPGLAPPPAPARPPPRPPPAPPAGPRPGGVPAGTPPPRGGARAARRPPRAPRGGGGGGRRGGPAARAPRPPGGPARDRLRQVGDPPRARYA